MTVNNPMVSVEFITEESAVSEFIKEIEKNGGKLQGKPEPWKIPPHLINHYGGAKFEPFIVISIAVSFGFLVKRISDVCLDHMKPGQVIDIRGGNLIVRQLPTLEHGTIVIIGDNGTQIFKKDKRDEAIEALFGSMPHG